MRAHLDFEFKIVECKHALGQLYVKLGEVEFIFQEISNDALEKEFIEALAK